jgi:type I restriction enzyme S subunit
MNKKKTVKFGDICNEVKLSTKDPVLDGYKRYIGLEHLDSGSLKIKRWGQIEEDSPSFTRIFKKGHILFGRRRAYLKKAAIAEFDGICSGDIIVMDANEQNILASLLPFVIQTNQFWAWAVKHSAGGLSPRTKFKALAEFELNLPSLNKQESIKNILVKSENVSLSAADLLTSNHSFFYNTLKGLTGVNSSDLEEFVSKNKEWELLKVKDVMVISNTKRKPLSSAVRGTMQGKYRYYGPTGVLDNINEYSFDGKYVLIGEDGDHFLKFANMPMTQLVEGKFNVNNHAHALKGSDKVLTEWFYYYFKHCWINKYLTRQGAGRYKLTKEVLSTIKIPVPPKEVQLQLCAVFKSMEQSSSALKDVVKENSHLSLSLRNKLLME